MMIEQTEIKPVAGLRVPDGEIFIHLPCHGTESWDENKLGPISSHGCDICDTSPDGMWRKVYVEVRP